MKSLTNHNNPFKAAFFDPENADLKAAAGGKIFLKAA
jgi:hypothetical protein